MMEMGNLVGRHPEMWGPMWLLGGFFSILFWAALIAFGIWAVRRFTDRPRSDDAMRTLRERYARGDIDSEEFDRRRRALEV